MREETFDPLFDKAACDKMLPAGKTHDFFEALLGDASEGSYDIELSYDGSDGSVLRFILKLHERPGHCLACNLTQGLPQVFSKHPIINIAGIVKQIDNVLGDKARTGNWQLGSTRQQSSSLHIIPLTIELV